MEVEHQLPTWRPVKHQAVAVLDQPLGLRRLPRAPWAELLALTLNSSPSSARYSDPRRQSTTTGTRTANDSNNSGEAGAACLIPPSPLLAT